jgi:preprotein translocase subunit SecE
MVGSLGFVIRTGKRCNDFMTEQVQEGSSSLDTAKLIAAVTLVVAGLVGFYYLSDWPIWGRWLLVLVGLTLGVLVAMQAAQGRALWDFVQSSRIELRKVVWRDRDSPSTAQVALVVLVVVAILTVVFWGLDAILAVTVRWLTGRS